MGTFRAFECVPRKSSAYRGDGSCCGSGVRKGVRLEGGLVGLGAINGGSVGGSCNWNMVVIGRVGAVYCVGGGL